LFLGIPNDNNPANSPTNPMVKMPHSGIIQISDSKLWMMDVTSAMDDGSVNAFVRFATCPL
jgi:hypothetical protein